MFLTAVQVTHTINLVFTPGVILLPHLGSLSEGLVFQRLVLLNRCLWSDVQIIHMKIRHTVNLVSLIISNYEMLWRCYTGNLILVTHSKSIQLLSDRLKRHIHFNKQNINSEHAFCEHPVLITKMMSQDCNCNASECGSFC